MEVKYPEEGTPLSKLHKDTVQAAAWGTPSVADSTGNVWGAEGKIRRVGPSEETLVGELWGNLRVEAFCLAPAQDLEGGLRLGWSRSRQREAADAARLEEKA